MKNTFEDKSDYLKQHGIKGMHWGERRWQYKDGSLTPAGRIHYGVGVKRYHHDADKANDVYKTLSDDEKYHLTGNAYTGTKNFDEQYETKENYSLASAYSLITEIKDVPVSVLDVYRNNNDNTKGAIAVSVRNEEQYRGIGLAKESVKNALDWFDKQNDILQLDWPTFVDNYGSRNLAEKMGFELNKEETDDKVVIYSKKKNNGK